MTVRNPPSFLQGITDPDAGHSAQNDRLTLGALFVPGVDPLSARSGILAGPPGGVGAVTLVSDTVVRTDPFRAVLQGTRNAVQGQYVVINDAALDRPITAQEAGVQRLDLVAIVVRDASYAPDTANNADVIVVRGDPVVTDPVAPALDGPDLGNFLVLGTLTVPPPGTPVTFTPNPDLLTVAVGGILPTATTDASPPAHDGQWRDAGGRLERGLGGAWTRPVGRHWGSIPGTAPSPNYEGVDLVATPGAEPGDTAYVESWRCVAMVVRDHGGSALRWRQIQVALVGNRAELDAYQANLAATGQNVHNGFQVYDSGSNQLWTSSGGTAFWPSGGYRQQRDPHGLVAATGWSVVFAVLANAGNGMATVEATVQRTGTALTVPVNGDIGNQDLATVPDGWHAHVSAPLSSIATGRVTNGWISNAGVLRLGSLSPGTNIATGDQLNVAGVYTLSNPWTAV